MAVNFSMISPIQAVYGCFRLDRVLALKPGRCGVMDSQVLRIEALDDGCKQRKLIPGWQEKMLQYGGVMSRVSG